MQRRGYSDFRHARPAARRPGNLAATQGLGALLDLERLDQLIQEGWYSMRQFRIGNLWSEPPGDLETAPFDEIRSISRKKFMEHPGSLS